MSTRRIIIHRTKEWFYEGNFHHKITDYSRDLKPFDTFSPKRRVCINAKKEIYAD